MIISWLKRLLNSCSSFFLGDEDREFMPTSHEEYTYLDEKKENVVKKKKEIVQSPLDWFFLSDNLKTKSKSIKLYCAYKFENITNLKALKEERLRKEARRLKVFEDGVKSLLDNIERQIDLRNTDYAKNELSAILEKIVKVKDSGIRQRYQQLQTRLSNLIDELKREELARLAEEKHRKEEEERKRAEAEIKLRQEKEKREQEERVRREAEAQRLAEEARRKEQTELAEKQRLMVLSSELKEDWRSFKQILIDNRVKCLYHFTDVRNIPSIKRHGGLLSWYYCHTHGIVIPCQGGDSDSMNLDEKYGLEDYVRLSFCDDHPMAYRLKKSGSNIVVLRVSIDVALLKDTQFSDMNAADKRHTHGKRLEHLQMVDFDATKMHYLRNDDPNFKPHQAEVMVKTFIPLKYIENI